MAKEFGAKVAVVHGDALQDGYPMAHAVGRAADKAFAPRLIEMKWGDPKNPRIAIIGKGVCFDSRSEEHTSELQSLMRISYAVFCLKKKKKNTTKLDNTQ